MPQLIYPYLTFPGQSISHPAASIIVQNPATGAALQLIGILDTGADRCVFNSQLMPALGLTPGPPTVDLAGVNGVVASSGWECSTLKVGFIAANDSTPNFPNGDLPVPVFFGPNVPITLIGRELFLNLCKVTFQHKIGQIQVEW